MFLPLTRETGDPDTNGPWPANGVGVKGFDNYGIMHNWNRIGFNKVSDPDWLIDAVPDAQGNTLNGGARFKPLPGGGVIISLDNTSNNGQKEWQITNDASTNRLKITAVGGSGLALEIDATTGAIFMPDLPSSTPGSKGLWYDAGSANVVKFTP
jgi:hypothetical protein